MTDIDPTYESLALRYRPTKFDDLVGQDTAVKTVRGMLRKQKIVRSIMITGPYGLGKTTLARLIAMSINCRKPTDGDPCGECPTCKQIRDCARDTSVHEINGADARGIDEARKLITTSQYAPRGFKYRTFIIDEVHQLTADAFKSLLKILEEPPPNTVFIICTTDPTKVPQEIRSRMRSCMLTMRPLPVELLTKLLRKIAKAEGSPIGTEPAARIASACRGHARDALGLLESVLNAQAGGKEGEDIDVDQLLNDLLGDASDAMGQEFLVHVYKGDVVASLGLLNRVYNHQIFCETITRLAAHAVRAAFDKGNALRDNHLFEFYETISDMKLNGKSVAGALKVFNEAAARVKAFHTNDPYAVMVAATVEACQLK